MFFFLHFHNVDAACSQQCCSFQGTKVATLVSLIDFSEDPEPTAPAAPPQQTPTPQQHPVNTPACHPVIEQGKGAPSVSGGDWASFDAFGQQQTQQPGSSANPLESALSQLSFSETPPPPTTITNKPFIPKQVGVG
jgi:hypothetical protein